MFGTVSLHLEKAVERGNLRTLLSGYNFGVDYRRQRARLSPSEGNVSGRPDYIQDFENGTMYILLNEGRKSCRYTTLKDAWRVPECLPVGLEPYFNWYRDVLGVANITTYKPYPTSDRSIPNYIYYYMRPGDSCSPLEMLDGKQVTSTAARYYRLVVKEYELDDAGAWLFPNTTGCIHTGWPWS